MRKEKDSLGEIDVPKDALYGAQTQRAINNFPISGYTMSGYFIKALALIKDCAAQANYKAGVLDEKIAIKISAAAEKIQQGDYLEHFPVDVFQTGSGTSSNMNMNEVIANLAGDVHPNDHVNMGQSSNDVVPSALHISSVLALTEIFLPAVANLMQAIEVKAISVEHVVKTGRTHLMDAMPLTLKQEMMAWHDALSNNINRLTSCMERLCMLAQGGTAIGTGINASKDFIKYFYPILSKKTDIKFKANDNFFVAISTQDTSLELASILKIFAVSIGKIANDMRLMNSGPLAGLAEISLPVLQPGSSIMPGKVNPVIPESVLQVVAQVIGNETVITQAAASSNFQLNVMLPVISYNLLESIRILSNAMKSLAENAIEGFDVLTDNIELNLYKNPILVTSLNKIIGYELGAKIAKTAYAEKRSVLDVALEMTDLSKDELQSLLNPAKLT